jgi:single-strand DNA-binding protein
VLAIAAALEADTTDIVDVALGDGWRLALGPTGVRSLELFPNTRTARLSTEDVQLTVYRVVEPTVDGAAVTISTQHQNSRLTVEASGSVALEIGDNFQVQEPAPDRRGERDNEHEQRERLTLSGRVGQNPRFKTTQKGTLVAQFPVAVRDDEQQTTWHRVVAFGDRAEKVRETVQRGQAVEVVGYRHTRTSRTRDGKETTIVEVYATVVRTR